MLFPILICVVAAMLAIAAAVLFLRARARETGGTSTDAIAVDSLGEMRAIGQRIETLVSQQQLQGETARQHLAQKLDAVGENIDQQRTHLSGLQNELRHEVTRRDAEMDEIRVQLASIQHATLGASAPLSLPPAEAPPALPVAEARTDWTDEASFMDETVPDEPFEAPTEAPAAEAPLMPTLPEFHAGDGLAASFDEAPFADGWDTGATEAPATEARTQDAPAAPFADPFAFDDPFAAPADDDAPASDFEPFDFQPPAEPEDDLADSFFEDVTFGSAPFASAPGPVFESRTPLPAPSVSVAAPPAPLAPPSDDSAWIARAGRADVPPVLQSASVPLVTPAPVPPAAVAAPPAPPPAAPAAPAVPIPVAAPPEGADDLTVISTIDEAMQSTLYAAGVITLDEIARWGRADARRIGHAASVPEETIMNQWVFEAQAALFQSFSTRK